MSLSSKFERYREDRGFVDPKDLAKGPNGRPLCRFCQTEVETGRRTFCSDACVFSWKLRTNGGFLREQVFERDRGVCSGCGLDTERLKSVLSRLAQTDHAKYLELTRRYKILHRHDFKVDRHYWEADHIIPVKQGGGQCGLENLTTLCVPCHKSKTKTQLSRKKTRRHGAKY